MTLTWHEIEIKGGWLINLVEEISKQLSVQAVTWLLLAAFSQILSEYQDQTAELNILKNCGGGSKKESTYKVGAKSLIPKMVNIKMKQIP